MGDKLVQTAVEGRFCDSAISAREAALELVGRHIASYPDVGLKVLNLDLLIQHACGDTFRMAIFVLLTRLWVVQYFEKLAERIKDTGVSVRKRAIKIIRDMCTSNSNFLELTTACVEIISRVNDEESSVQVEVVISISLPFLTFELIVFGLLSSPWLNSDTRTLTIKISALDECRTCKVLLMIDYNHRYTLDLTSG